MSDWHVTQPLPNMIIKPGAPGADQPDGALGELGASVIIANAFGEPMVSIHPPGQIVFNENYTPDEVAHTFWGAISRNYCISAMSQTYDRITTQEEEISRLRALVEELEAARRRAQNDRR